MLRAKGIETISRPPPSFEAKILRMGPKLASISEILPDHTILLSLEKIHINRIS